MELVGIVESTKNPEDQTANHFLPVFCALNRAACVSVEGKGVQDTSGRNSVQHLIG
jgi:hypothetical protein